MNISIGYDEILAAAKKQSATDMNCTAEDFDSGICRAVVSEPSQLARKYLSLPFFCNIVSYGSNVVASCDKRIIPDIEGYLNSRESFRCFETPALHLLTALLSPYGYSVCFQAEYWLPVPSLINEKSCGYSMRLLEKDELDLLDRSIWHNALSAERPQLDILGAGAYENGTLVGLAACSADCESMWQIGIDVFPAYRRQGIASALTGALAAEILRRGKIPFYCCAWSNIASARNAVASGFRPAWTELTALPTERTMKYV